MTTQGDGIRPRINTKGEEWTVLRPLLRLVCHAIDNAEQPERGEVRD